MKKLNNIHHLIIFSSLLAGSIGSMVAMKPSNNDGDDLKELHELSLAKQTGPQPQLELYKLMAELDLSKTNLRELSPSIGSMKQLRRLNLEDNGLKALPDAVGDLKKLKKLNVGRNFLVTLPDAISRLNNLEELNAERNKLTALPDLSGQKKLRRLKLSRNNVTELPSTLADLSNLHEIDASNNKLSELPDLSKLNNLAKLDLEQNPLGMGESNTQGKPASACSTALALYRIVGKNCIHAAYKLHTILESQTTHKYLKHVLAGLFARVKDKKDTFSLALIPKELVRNDRFCSNLKQSMSGIHARIEEKPDPALPAMKELHKHLHYYTWLEALNNTQKAYCTSPFYTEPFKGLPENLQLIIWSMIHDQDN